MGGLLFFFMAASLAATSPQSPQGGHHRLSVHDSSWNRSPAPTYAALDRYTDADLRHLYPDFAHLFPDQPPTVETPITPAIVAAAKDMGVDPALLVAMLVVCACDDDF